MENLIEFGRMFLSYGMLMLIIAAVAAVAVAIGITLSKRNSARRVREEGKEQEK